MRSGFDGTRLPVRRGIFPAKGPPPNHLRGRVEQGPDRALSAQGLEEAQCQSSEAQPEDRQGEHQEGEWVVELGREEAGPNDLQPDQGQ